jgi:hypothetical protein
MPPKSAKDTRPRIWAEGRQNPPLEPRAFALASVAFARDSLSGLLMRCAASADGLGAEVGAGRWRVPADRLGRTGRYLPSAEAVGRVIRGGAGVLSRAAQAVNPALAEAPKSIFTAMPTLPLVPEPTPAPARPAPTALPVEPTTDDPDLDAIRALIGANDAEQAAPRRRPAAAPVQHPEPVTQVPQPTDGWRRAWVADMTGAALGYGLLVVSVPVGAGLALMAHLNGEDLRKLAEPS